MRYHSGLITLLLGGAMAFASMGAGASELPELAKPGKSPLVSAEFIYPLEGRATPQCHASTLAETREGLVVAWFAGKHEKAPDVGIRVSRLVDGKWSTPVEVVNGVESPDKRYPCWNPVLFQPGDGPLLLFYKVGPNPREWWGMLMTSDDSGKSWSAPRRLGEDDAMGHLIGPVKNKPIQFDDGSILCPSSSEHDGWRVHFERTRDLGKTWEVIGPINDGKEFGAIQPSILTYPGGRMQVVCRSRQDVLTQSWSKDGGKTWGPMTATHLPNPSAGTDAVTLKDGRQLLVYNHTTRKTGGRNRLHVALSTDGLKWRTVMTLENEDREAGYSYPAVIQTKDGLVHATYTWGRVTIKHVVIDPERF